jgi:hypothetical protein
MRVAVQILFLLFYVVSTYVVKQEKVATTILQVRLHAENHETLRDAKGPVQGLPKYREAKKANKDFENGPEEIPELIPLLISAHFPVRSVWLKAQLTLDTAHSRAPPTVG